MFPMVIHGRSPKRWKCHSIFSSLPDSLSLRKTFSIGVGWGERGGTGFEGCLKSQLRVGFLSTTESVSTIISIFRELPSD